MSRFLACLAALLLTAPALAADAPSTPGLPYLIPGTMVHGRFYVEAFGASGQRLQLVTDTGGGTNITTLGADKLGLKYTIPENRLRDAAGEAAWPAFAGAWIPEPRGGGDTLPILVPPAGITFDGMLGAAWFADRTWEWDYPAGTLRLMPDGALPGVEPAHVVKLGFQKDDDGNHTSHFPRIPARVAGEERQFLFDTGATFRLNEDAAAVLGDRQAFQRAGSFITTTVMQGWRERHPDWQYIETGDGQAPMILVPDVEVAGYHTGPVWFSARPDRAFHAFLARWTDQPLDGALGGNALRTFRVTVDYTSETATFEQPPSP